VCIKCNKAIAMIQAYSLSISTFPSWPCYLCIMQHDNVTIKGRSQMQEKQPMSHHRLLMWVQHFLHSRNKERHVPCSKEKKIEYMTKENNKMCTACEKVKFRGNAAKQKLKSAWLTLPLVEAITSVPRSRAISIPLWKYQRPSTVEHQ
jgi:hypothetical protein